MKPHPLSSTAGHAASVAPAPHARDRGAASPAAAEVHIWRACLDKPDAVVTALQALLSADERERAGKFFFERDRRRFVVGRGILRTLLGSYLDRHPAGIAFRYSANGKPSLVLEDGESPIYFNVAHTEELALFAFTRAGEIGIDVERMREMADWPSIAEVSFSPEERERLRRCPAARRREEFFHAWTRQEAILKAVGTGLGGAAPRAEDFTLYPLDAGSGVAAAFAIARSAGRAAVRSFVTELGDRKPALLQLP